jgi:energy-converting hydrogenase Eha subunit E
MTAATATSAVRGRGTAPTWLMATVLATTSVIVGLVAGGLVSSGQAAGVFALGAVALVVVLWKEPALSPVVVLLAALTVEQFPFQVTQPGATSPGLTPSDMTDRIPLFHGLARNVHVSPADLLLLTLVVIWLLKRGTGATARVPRSPVTYGVGALLGAVAIGLVVGQAHHGSLRTAFTEVRPYVYLGLAYLLASVFANRLGIIRAAFWALVVGSGLKAAQAIHSFLSVRHQQPRPDFVVGHEEALFFALFVLLTLGLWLFEVRGRLRTTATLLLPLVLVADLVNSRRAAWLILGGALIVLTIIGLVAVPARRQFLTRMLAVLALVSIIYFPVYWNHTGALAGPARAMHSAVAPNPRDEQSDLYRVQENANLKHNIKEGGVIGRGFGVPIDYALPITDISSIDPLIAYIPHNGVLYIFMRMGLLGGLAFWSLLGAGIISGCRLARSRNREIALFGALLACALFGYALEGYNDQGFFMYRIAFVIGSLLGLGEAARRLSAQVEPEVAVSTVPAPASRPRAVVAPRAVPVFEAPVRAIPARVPATAESIRRRLQTDRVAQLASFALLPFAIGFLIWLVFAGPGHSTKATTQLRPVPATAPVRELAPTPGASELQVATLVLTDVRHDSWVEVRRDSRAGPILYSGVVPAGDRVSARGSRLWARFGGASNLEVTLNGKPFTVEGTVEVLFTAKGARLLTGSPR